LELTWIFPSLHTSGELRVVTRDMEDVPLDGESVGEIVVRGNVVKATTTTRRRRTSRSAEVGSTRAMPLSSNHFPANSSACEPAGAQSAP
jgi:hypothetical protein